MASNFQVFSYETRDTLHLKLFGDFDGTSAFQLVKVLKRHGAGFRQIFIDVSNLNVIYPFALEVFQKELCDYNQKPEDFIFLGKNRQNISLTGFEFSGNSLARDRIDQLVSGSDDSTNEFILTT